MTVKGIQLLQVPGNGKTMCGELGQYNEDAKVKLKRLGYLMPSIKAMIVL